ncbi:MAG: Txe/YoeB family addiction module toxin [Bifidobacteriaceae bacterium]|jgi:toxin YoeB|nr:Txe/YoeB family addiction module toxin [Bifidobacteriaceae bacterium]
MQKVWTDDAWADYLYWQTQDRKTLRRINALLKDIERDPFQGIGKPEPLTGDLQGYWSRRVDESNRIVYKIEGTQMVIAQCGGHYGDK